MPVSSGDRRTTASTNTKGKWNNVYECDTGADNVIGKNEIDNHADTICAGPNWRVVEFTGEYCDVSPFSSTYQPLKNVPVAKCATVYTCNTTGATVLLVADQVLWFGSSLGTSLINPHQLRAYGLSVCDDPWDPHRILGIDTDEIHIPFYSHGTNLYFESRSPSTQELDTLPSVFISGPRWNPNDVEMPTRSVSVYATNRNTCVVSHRDTFASEPERLLANISPVYNTRALAALYSSTVRAGTPTGTETGTVAATITSDRHTKVTPENLSRIWNVGLDTAKRALQVTTQRGIRTALHPLHRRYRVDHLHLNRRRLNGDWYTDTLFAKVKSLQGNVCAQVYTNGSYTTVHPMTSKSRVAETLTEFADDTGIPDTLTSDGAPEMVGAKTDFMREVNRLKIRLKRAEVGKVKPKLCC
jgi:hypothetical protein